MTPEQVVQKYLDISFSMNTVDDRAKLVNLTIGPLREQLETVPDISIAEAFVDKRYLLEEYELIERRDRTPRETEITYIDRLQKSRKMEQYLLQMPRK